jgi:hypothetical protein
MFKEKSSKKKLNIDNKEISTLDAMHNKMIKNFENVNKEKDTYITLLNHFNEVHSIIINEMNYVKTLQNKEAINTLCSSNITVKEQILDIEGKLKELGNHDEIEYYKNTSDILFQYYNTVEKQSSIMSYNINAIPTLMSTTTANKQSGKSKSDSKKKKAISNGINVLDALNNDPEKNTNKVIETCDSSQSVYSIQSTQPSYATTQVIHNDVLQNEYQANDNECKSLLVDKYLSIINKQYVKKVYQEDIEICQVCKSSMVCLQYDAIMICDKCGYQELLLVEQNRPILKQNTKDTSHFSYKRINHFREWCNQVQGKESTDIPDEIFEKILHEIKKEKISDTKTITYNKMRDILKRLRINKYYEHINYIINRINGIPTPQFSPDLEEKLCNMFRNIQGPFLKHCPKDRKNFLSYSYVLYKFFQILGLHEYLKYFPLLKSREKLYVQDQIWKKICKELNYDIIPSL